MIERNWTPIFDPKDEPVYACPHCRDEPSGWRFFACAGVPLAPSKQAQSEHVLVVPCARRQQHYPHTYVERCGCFGRNEVVAEQKAKAERFKKPADPEAPAPPPRSRRRKRSTPYPRF